MAQVAVYTNMQLPGILNFVKNCVADSTGRQEPTIFATLHELQSARFGQSDVAMYIDLQYVGVADVFRTQRILQYICQKLVYKYGIAGDDIYVTFTEQAREQVYIAGQSL